MESRFRFALPAILLFALGGQPARAQPDTASGRSAAYAFGAVVIVPQSPFTRWDGTFGQAGFGAEGAIGRFVTAGGEIAVLLPGTNRFARTSGLGTAGASFHPSGSGSRADPFVSGGAGTLVSPGRAAAVYFGGGVNYWMRPRCGFRIEYRHHYVPNADGAIHLAGIRFGVIFR